MKEQSIIIGLTSWRAAGGGKLASYFQRRETLGEALEDLVQEVFLNLAKRQVAENVDAPDRYAHRKAANVLHDSHRNRHARRVLDHTDLDAEILISEEPCQAPTV